MLGMRKKDIIEKNKKVLQTALYKYIWKFRWSGQISRKAECVKTYKKLKIWIVPYLLVKSTL